MEILLGNNEYSVDKINLRKWLELEDIREKLIKAIEIGNMDNMVLSLLSYISIALNISIEQLQDLPWYEIAFAYSNISIICIPRYDLAVLRPRNQNLERKVSWDYDGRTFYLWSHLLADSYGWTLDEISELDFNDALALLQEIMVDEQLEKEWQWALSEIAYPYDENTKRNRFHPLHRPDWMKEQITAKPIKKTKIFKAMMPIGNVVWMPEDEAIIH